MTTSHSFQTSYVVGLKLLSMYSFKYSCMNMHHLL